MSKKIAVAVIHGISRSAEAGPASSDGRRFSNGLYKRLGRELGREVLASDVVWREINWADVISERQDEYLLRIKRLTKFASIRRFLVQGISDAAAFHARLDRPKSAYARILDRVREAMASLRAELDDDTPLVVIAHSFGSHIVSSYIWDMQQGRFSPPTPFERFETLDRFITMGSNIPMFTFDCPEGHVYPIRYPGTAYPLADRKDPWWTNIYDKHDVLGFPIGPVADRYEAMVRDGQLEDLQINAGGLFRSWNPFSHDAYWTDRDFYRPVANVLRELMARHPKS